MMRDTCNCCGNFNLFGARLEIIKKGGYERKGFLLGLAVKKQEKAN